jgi:hypothetical protein
MTTFHDYTKKIGRHGAYGVSGFQEVPDQDLEEFGIFGWLHDGEAAERSRGCSTFRKCGKHHFDVYGNEETS